MGIVLVAVMLLGAGILVRSLRVSGCVGFVLWMVLGMAVVWFAMQFASGGLWI